jgi:hypothetical protein
MDDALSSVISAPVKKNGDVLPSPEWDIHCSFQRKNWYEWQHNTHIIGMKKCCQFYLLETNKRNSLELVICDTHCVRLCNGKPQPGVRLSGMILVDGKTLVTNFSWAAPDPDMNCWDNSHQFYLPHFVKPKEHQPLFDKNNIHFCHIAVSSNVNRKKMRHWGKLWKSEAEKEN